MGRGKESRRAHDGVTTCAWASVEREATAAIIKQPRSECFIDIPCTKRGAPPNAPVQLRAVGPRCALSGAIRRSEQALNRNASSARQLQRVLEGRSRSLSAFSLNAMLDSRARQSKCDDKPHNPETAAEYSPTGVMVE
jgi:hypothetical protein